MKRNDRVSSRRQNKNLVEKFSTILLLEISMLLVPLMLQAQKPVLRLSLKAALDTAMQNNAKIREYHEKTEQKKYLKKLAVGNFFPSISVNGGVSWMSQNPEINMSPLKKSIDNLLTNYGTILGKGLQLPPDAQIILTKTLAGIKQLPAQNLIIDQQNYPNLNITLIQPLFTGGKIRAGKKFADAEWNYSNDELRQTKNEIIKETIDRYYAIVLLKAVVRTRKEVLAGMKRHEMETQKAIKAGILPPYTRLRAEVAVANAQRDLSDDENRLDLAKLALKTTMGMNQDIKIEVTGSLHFQACPLNLDQLQSEAKNSQPLFKMIDQKRIMVKQNRNMKIAQFLPQIGAWGTYSMLREKYPVIPSPFMVGIQAKINLFRGGKKFNDLKAAQHLQKEVEAADEFAHQQVNLCIDKSYRQVLDKEERYRKLQPTIALARKNYEITEKRFHEGMAKSIDVIDARLLYEKVRIEAYQTLYDYYVSLSNLYLATGNPQKLTSILIHHQ